VCMVEKEPLGGQYRSTLDHTFRDLRVAAAPPPNMSSSRCRSSRTLSVMDIGVSCALDAACKCEQKSDDMVS